MAIEDNTKHHTLSKLNKTLCRFLAALMIIMCLSYYITTLLQVRLSRLSGETIKLNNENVELQNKLDNLMSYHNVENLVRQRGNLDTATQVIEIDGDSVVVNKVKKKKYYPNYYRWSLGF
jgi:flagellar biosynthesis protein FlhB